MQGVDGGFPVEGGRPGTVVDERGKVVAGEPGFVGDDQPSGGLQRVEAFGASAERSCE
jgi:hypothetical protein